MAATFIAAGFEFKFEFHHKQNPCGKVENRKQVIWNAHTNIAEPQDECCGNAWECWLEILYSLFIRAQIYPRVYVIYVDCPLGQQFALLLTVWWSHAQILGFVLCVLSSFESWEILWRNTCLLLFGSKPKPLEFISFQIFRVPKNCFPHFAWPNSCIFSSLVLFLCPFEIGGIFTFP